MKKSRGLDLLEKVKLRLLTTKTIWKNPRATYQPLPFLGLNETRRSQGCKTRMAAIETCLEKEKIHSGFVVDYGCNIGFFLLTLARKGFCAIGIEEDDKSVQIGLCAARLIGQPLAMIPVRVSAQNVRYMPGADVSICLSVWHHWVRHYGFDDATRILKSLFEKTEKVLFFDTGEGEMPAHYNLPFEGDGRAWLEAYFLRDLGASRVEWLGKHKAFAPGTSEGDAAVERNLFAVFR